MPANDPSPNSKAPRIRDIKDRASRLAERQSVSPQVEPGPTLLGRVRDLASILREAYHTFVQISEEQEVLSSAAEWLLDNFYIVQQAIRQIREDMPRGYYRRLPKLDAGELEGAPRIYELALQIVESCEGRLNIGRVTRFVRIYQQTTPLSMGELWALPTMLRLISLELLAQTVARMLDLDIGEEGFPFDLSLPDRLTEDQIVSNSILSLRVVADQDWKIFFETLNPVDEALREDPAGIYARMDFETRDRYRGVVEELARASDRSEVEVAREAVRLAEEGGQGKAERPWDGYVGFYLLGEGRGRLEEVLDYSPPQLTRLRRWVFDHPTPIYLGGIGLFTLLVELLLVGLALAVGGTALWVVITALVVLLPAMDGAVNLVNWIITSTVPPRLLPKLDLGERVPADFSTMVVVPALITSSNEVNFLLGQLELHYLGNSDPHVRFALLTDFADAPEEYMPEDEELIQQAREGIRALNERYGRRGYRPFYLFHRYRQWNPAEECWMGWERKRGKLVEFNRLLQGEDETSYHVQVGDLDVLPEIRFVLTLDADTTLPRGAAARLIGTLAHPLNRPVFEGERVVAGYTVLQPRVEIEPSSGNRSLFSRIFSGDTGLDLYTRAVSDVYQDFFGAGIYVGKGIYDVEGFERSLEGRIPENAVLSHDLLEGIHGRAGLVTDVVLYEGYPPGYLTHIRRLHRWVRGDWQILPWLFPRVPHEGEGRIPNKLSAIDRWKILDNLRRSLRAPAFMALLVLGWLWLPGPAWAWTVIGLFLSAIPFAEGMMTDFLRRVRGAPMSHAAPPLGVAVARWALSMTFLAHRALLELDAIGTTLVRLLISRKRLLQWTTSAHTIRLFRDKQKIRVVWEGMGAASLLGLAIGLIVGLADIGGLLGASPLLLAWVISPYVAFRISQPIRYEPKPLPEEQQQQLRRLARRTWYYFERFVGPEDHWLPPDHFQEEPRGVTAHRTSPTNIGLYLLSTLAAHELGYIPCRNLVIRLRSTFSGMDRLERYRDHFLNWYDTQALEPLRPRYVSTVDSGNLAAALLTLRQGLEALTQEPLLRWHRWQGLLDTLGLLEEVVEEAKETDSSDLEASADSLKDRLSHIQQRIWEEKASPQNWIGLLETLSTEHWPEIGQLVSGLVEADSHHLSPSTLRGLRVWMERVDHHLRGMRNELGRLLPWVRLLEASPPFFAETEGLDPSLAEAWQALQEALPITAAPVNLPAVCRRGRERLDQLRDRLDHQLEAVKEEGNAEQVDRLEEAQNWCERLEENLADACEAAESLLEACYELEERAAAFYQGMLFDFLFDPHREVFYIGYNATAGRMDPNHYDLLASEARIASLIAIAKGDVPQSHWLHLGRPLTSVDHIPVLLSWNGSMFEYLMPGLLMQSYRGTLLHQTRQGVVRRQMAYARQHGVPWGVSESGYYQFDANMNYQYRGFGVPGVGRKRGLGEDLVITPYASLLALPVRPRAVMENLSHLIEEGMLGFYGLYEAVDYTSSRLPLGEERGLVRSYMAHHQGMILLALTNYLEDGVILRRFHTDPQTQSVDLLLQEQIPSQAPTEGPPEEEEITAVRRPQPRVQLTPWRPSLDSPMPQVHLLSNGRYYVVITAAGSSYSHWRDLALTRFRSDTTLDRWGTWIYLQDQESGEGWSVAAQPTGTKPDSQAVLFYPHKAEFRRRDHDISLRMEVIVAPEEDVEIRRLSLTNRGDRTRRLRLTSYGEVVLTDQATDRRHPAFNKLFIESEFLPDLNSLLFRRRPTGGEDSAYLVHLLALEEGIPPTGAHEGNRGRFIGRGRSVRSPAALEEGLSGTTGATLDPIMSLGQDIRLEADATVRLAFVTLVAPSRQEALALARRYRSLSVIEQAFDRARSEGRIDLNNRNLDVPQVEQFQKLLSVLLYPHAALRTDPRTIAANRKGQSGLWSFAISGDYPILMVRIDDPEELDLVWELLRAHDYWRDRGIKVDLVVLNRQDVSYTQELQGRLRRLVNRMDSDVLLDQRGGIFLLRLGQMDEAGRVLLETSARAILDGGKGGLEKQLEPLQAQPTPLPPFSPTLSHREDREPTPSLPRPSDLGFDNELGGFSADGREYLIYLEPGERTPAPWINVIANDHFGFLVSEAGSGYTWAVNSGENRLTPWRNDPVSDPPGEALYLRDEETGRVWTPTPLPSGEETPYLVRHGAGYSIFEHHSHGLKQRFRLFAAPDDPVKVIHLRLENVWDRPRRITATYYAEWVLGTDRHRMQQYVVPTFDGERGALLARNVYNAEFGQRVAFLAASKEPHGLTADRTEFLGRHGGRRSPAALRRIGLASRVKPGLDPCAALQVHLDMKPGETKELFFLLGQGEDRGRSLELIETYRDGEQVEAAWKGVTERWDDLLGRVTVETPDPAMDLLLNRWLLYQALACRVWARSGFYQSSGAYGYRDQLQDVMSLLNSIPEVAREHILRAARHQFEAGDVLHWWHPPSGRGVRTRITDDLLWLPFVTAQYVRTTGDRSILDEEVPFVQGEPLEPEEMERYGYYRTTPETYSLYEHCRRAIEKGTTAGEHGLPLMGSGDWNDGMNWVGNEGEGESVWLGWFLYAVLTRFASLCEGRGDDDQAAAYRERAADLQESLHQGGWDGQWYRRAYYDDGTPLGSAENQECQIDSIAQSWSVLSGAGDSDRQKQAMEEVEERLVREEDGLILLFTPPFNETPRNPGYIKGYPPGIRENGGQYTHAALWAVWAFVELGEGDRASALFRLLNPIRHADAREKVERYRVEPYVVAADVYGAPPHTGRGGWTWYTGSSGWMLRLGLEGILGVRRVGEGLRIDPTIPSDWPGFRVTYRYEETVYRIQVENPDGVNRGVEEIKLDGEPLSEGEVPLTDDGEEHTVHVRMGNKREEA